MNSFERSKVPGSDLAGGIALALAAVLALAWANSPWAGIYEAILRQPLGPRWFGASPHALTLHAWIDDFWMAGFFFLVGLELKREWLVGQLSTRSQALLPAAAALGGMVAPALIYALVNRHDAAALRGWAIPAATDIAFAVGLLAIASAGAGARLPPSLKVFLTTLAVIDDLGAIGVIAAFYTADLDLRMLAAAALPIVVLWLFHRLRLRWLSAYLGAGLVLWWCVLQSGIHPTLAGVLTAFAVPLRDRQGGPVLDHAERRLAPWVKFAILPAFAWANAGVSFAGVSFASALGAVPLGIAAGLVAGKLAGVGGVSWLCVRLRWAAWPLGATTLQFVGVCLLCGVGFTMSLFIGNLAFATPELQTALKLGVLGGSSVAAVLGLTVLKYARRQRMVTGRATASKNIRETEP